MISSATEYQKTQEELAYLHAWIQRLSGDTSTDRSGFTEASVRTMISRVEEEIAEYEATKKDSKHATDMPKSSPEIDQLD